MDNTLNQKNKILWLSQVFFFMAVFFKQFYILPSGGLQIGDILFMISFSLLFLSGKMKKNHFFSRNFLYVVFLICACYINLMYFVVYENKTFIMSSMYYIYNCIVMCTFLQHMEKDGFLKRLAITIKTVIIAQLAIYFASMGRWYLGYRYMGTFNDPNQFAFYMFAALLLLVIINTVLEEKSNFIWILSAVFLVYESASIGALLGIGVLFIGHIIMSNEKKSTIVWKSFAISLVIVVVAGGLINQLPEVITSSEAYVRLMQKVNKFVLDDTTSLFESFRPLLEERGWHRLSDYPSKILYGAGEGQLSRFGGNLEIHSSILGILFYYGLFPSSCLFLWIINKFKKIDKRYWYIYISLFTEAVFLNNTRQPFFWMLLILMELNNIKKNNSKHLEG